MLLSLVDETRAVDGPAATAAILVVTNDRELKARLHARGRPDGRRGLAARPARPRRERPAADRRQVEAVEAADEAEARRARTAAEDDDPDAGRWEPGRGATVKKGNPRKAPRSAGRD